MDCSRGPDYLDCECLSVWAANECQSAWVASKCHSVGMASKCQSAWVANGGQNARPGWQPLEVQNVLFVPRVC
eukprot:scaffold24076_cov21-Tisochrysis_lutea.AAC.2